MFHVDFRRFAPTLFLPLFWTFVACEGPRRGDGIETRRQDLTTTTFVGLASSWKYLDTGSDQGTAWRNEAFNDSSWNSANAQLGYGDGDEATITRCVVGVSGCNTSATNKFITTYFRKTFTVTNPAAVASLTLRLMRDDGAVVYLNGVEVVRSNLPSGTITYTTLAPASVDPPDESAFYSFTVAPALLHAGNNTLAVEVHQILSRSYSSQRMRTPGYRRIVESFVTRSTSSSSAVAISTLSIGSRWRSGREADRAAILGVSGSNSRPA